MSLDNGDSSSCQVCGRPKAKKSYNSFVCNPCRVFFYRNSSKTYISGCDATANCDISYKKLRMNCTSCRLKKCIEVNMSKTEERKSVVDALHLTSNAYAPMKKLTQMYTEIINNGFKVIVNLKNCERATEWVDHMASFDRQILAPGGPSPSTVVANTSMSLGDFLTFPGACIDRSTAYSDCLATVIPAVPYKLKETLCRIFVASVENMTCIEEFHLLPNTDKFRLLQQNALMSYGYVLMYSKLSKGWDINAFAQYMSRFKKIEGVEPLWTKTSSVWSSSTCIKGIQLMEETLPTEKECLLLRIRSLFRPCPDLSPEGLALAIQVRLRLAHCLGQYMRERDLSLTYSQIHIRLRKLLELELYFKDNDDQVRPIYVALTLQHTGWRTPLLHDIFVRKF